MDAVNVFVSQQYLPKDELICLILATIVLPLKKITKKFLKKRKVDPKFIRPVKYKLVLARRPNTEEMIRIMAQLRAMAVKWKTIWIYVGRTIFWLILEFCLLFLIEDFLHMVLDLYENMNMSQDKLDVIIEKMKTENLYSFKNSALTLLTNYLLPLSIIGLLVAATIKKSNPDTE